MSLFLRSHYRYARVHAYTCVYISCVHTSICILWKLPTSKNKLTQEEKGIIFSVFKKPTNSGALLFRRRDLKSDLCVVSTAHVKTSYQATERCQHLNFGCFCWRRASRCWRWAELPWLQRARQSERGGSVGPSPGPGMAEDGAAGVGCPRRWAPPRVREPRRGEGRAVPERRAGTLAGGHGNWDWLGKPLGQVGTSKRVLEMNVGAATRLTGPGVTERAIRRAGTGPRRGAGERFAWWRVDVVQPRSVLGGAGLGE